MSTMKQFVLTLLFCLLAQFYVVPQAHALTPPNLIWSRSIPGHIVQSSPTPISIDGSTKDIIIGAWDGKVYGIRGEDGADLAGWPAQTAKSINSSPAIADVTGDGQEEIFVGSGKADYECSGGGLYSFNKNGTQRFHFLANDNVSNGGSAPCADLAIHGSPALGDVNHDGFVDVLFGALGVRTWSIKGDGILNFGWPFHWDDTQFASPALGDINNDGRVEIVAGGDASPGGIVNHRGGLVRALTGQGQELWEYRINEIVYSSPVIGDIDGDGQPEIVFGAGNFWASNGGSTDSTKLFVLSNTGILKWSKDLGAQTLAAPALADMNGDGKLDIAIGTWTGTQAGKIWALDGNGNNLPGYPRASGGNLVIGQVVTADLDNDGGQDIVTTTGDGVYAYSGKTGALLFTLKSFGSFQNSAIITDLDNDGLLDIVIGGSPDNVTGIIERYEMPAGSSATLGSLGWPKFRKDVRQTGSWLSTPLNDSPSGTKFQGYWLVASSGQIYPFGSAKDFGSAANLPLVKPIVGMASTPSGQGYWLTAADGGVLAYGDAGYFGSMGNKVLNKPIVGIQPTASGLGYWLVAADGGIFCFGDATFFGSAGNLPLVKPIVGMAATPSGNGYWLAASDGGIFTYGGASFFGSAGNLPLVKPIVGMAATPSGNGYWLAASDGGIFTYGGASFFGSAGGQALRSPITGINSLKNNANGYWLGAADAGIFSYGTATYYGSYGGAFIPSQAVGISAVGF